MSLPIIRLRTVDANQATAADDPVTASCTLYTFLRSVPSSFECAMAMSDFRHAVQATKGQRYLWKNNMEMLQLVYASVHDRLLRHPPSVIPQLARNAPTWRRVLSGEESVRSANSTTTASQSQDHGRPLQDDESTQPPMPGSSMSSSFLGVNNSRNTQKSDGLHDSSEGHQTVLVEAASMRVKGPYDSMRPPPGSSFLLDCSRISARSKNSMEAEENTDANTANVPTALPAAESLGNSGSVQPQKKGYQLHPLLLAILDRVRSSLSPEENEDDRLEREFATMMESREAALRTKILSAFSMIPPTEKGCLDFLKEMETRVAVAKKLFEVQKYEEETIRITHCALKVEILTMRTLLRQILDAVAETEERHEREGPRTPHYAEECHVMAAIQQALDDLPA